MHHCLFFTGHCSQCYLDSATRFTWQVLDDCNTVFRHRPVSVSLAVALVIPVLPGLSPTPQSSWQPFSETGTSGSSYALRRYVLKTRSNELAANVPVIVELLEVPSKSEKVPAPMERTVPDVVHLVQYGIVPCRAPTTKSFPATMKTSRLYETATLFGDQLIQALMRHLVTSGSAKPVFRSAHDRRHPSPKPENRFDNNVPNRLLEQTRLSTLSSNPGPRRGREGAVEEHMAGKWHVARIPHKPL